MVIYAPHHGEVWMTAWEIAELLNVTGTTVNNTIKRIWKQGVLKDFKHSQYIKLDNGYSADVYSLDVIIAIALQVDTYQALLFLSILCIRHRPSRLTRRPGYISRAISSVSVICAT